MTHASTRHGRFSLAAVVMVVAGLVASLAPATSAASAAAMPSVPPDTGRLTPHQLRREVRQTLEDAGYIGLSVMVRDGDRRIRARAGEAELGTRRPVPLRGNFRAASATKAFVSTVALQLIGEGRLSLDDTVEQWLPGVVAGNGNDGTRITIRHLLQHTSGIHNYDYSDDVGTSAEDFERTRFDHVSPEPIVAGAMRSQPDFPPADPTDPEPDWGTRTPTTCSWA